MKNGHLGLRLDGALAVRWILDLDRIGTDGNVVGKIEQQEYNGQREC